MKNPTSILDPRFRYTSASKTDIAKTFARIRREQKALQAERETKVTSIVDRKAAKH
jgi:hypothetical protein